MLDDIQAAPIDKPDIDEKWITVPADVGDVAVRIVKPVGADRARAADGALRARRRLGRSATPAPTTGWSASWRCGAHAAVVFVEYDRAPEAQYPVAIEQAYATAQWIMRDGITDGLDHTRLAVAGDSVGGNMAAALTILAKQRGDVTFVHQSLYYPVTDAAQDTDSYREFAHGPYLRAQSMAWFWDAYLPHWEGRGEITASPFRASLDELAGLPDAFVVVDENDVLPRRGRGLCPQADRRRRADDLRPVQRHAPRLHDAQPPARHGGDRVCGRTGDPRAADARPSPEPTEPSPSTGTSRRIRRGVWRRRSRPPRGTHRQRPPSLPTPAGSAELAAGSPG